MQEFGVLLAIALVAGFAIVLFAGRRGWRHQGDWPPPPAGETIAVIEEHAKFSMGGVIAVIMLVLFNAAAVANWYAAANVLQQSTAAQVWIGWNVLWGIGAIIGRKRTYVVRRLPRADAA